MCRSIKQLRLPNETPTDADMHAAALQFVRKISGYRVPSRANQAAFDAAVNDIAAITQRLLEQLAPAQHAPAAQPQPHAAIGVADDVGQPQDT